jgi:hypothetical protein
MLAALSVVHEDWVAVVIDADGAYLQTPRSGPPMFAKLPWELMDEGMRKMEQDGQDPRVSLRTWVYGEPGAGDYWSIYLVERMVTQGWRKIAETANGGTLFERNGQFFGIYTDDGLMVGPPTIVMTFICELRTVIDFTEPKPLEKMLGTEFQKVTVSPCRGLAIHQSRYAEHVLARFIEDNGGPPRGRRQPTTDVSADRELLKPGKFVLVARKHLGGVAYLVRMSRPDLAYATNALLREVDRWSYGSDDKLVALFGYIGRTLSWGILWRMHETETVDDLIQYQCSDSDHAGDSITCRSTSGWAIFWKSRTGRSTILIDWGSKLQTATARNTCEAETTAANDSFSKGGLAINEISEELLRRKADTPVTTSLEGSVDLIHEVDNDAARLIMQNLKASLPYLRKHQRVNLGFLRDVVSRKGRCLRRVASVDNVSDIFTKAMSTADVFEGHRATLGMVDMKDYTQLFEQSAALPEVKLSLKAKATSIVVAVGHATATAGAITIGALKNLLADPEFRAMALKWLTTKRL